MIHGAQTIDRDFLPMSIGDVFDEAFDLYKNNFSLFAGIVAVVHVPATIAISILIRFLHFEQMEQLGDTAETTALVMGIVTVLIVMMLAYSLAISIQQGALVLAVSQRYLGRSVGLIECYRSTMRKFWKITITWFISAVLSSVLMWLFTFAVSLIMALLITAVGYLFSHVPQVMGVVIAVLTVIWLLLVCVVILAVILYTFIYVTQVIMLERSSYFGAIERNAKLISRRFWRNLFSLAALISITTILGFAIYGSFVGLLELTLFNWLHVAALIRYITEGLLAGLIALFVQPFWLVCITLQYYDNRIRREGFDLSLLETELVKSRVEVNATP